MLGLAEILAGIAAIAVSTIESLGYPGIFVLMGLESMIAPVPSELVMPFAGFLAAGGRFDLVFVIVVSTVGSIAGSWISYEAGKRWGIEAIRTWGKWVLLDESHLKWTQNWFEKSGDKTILIARFVPVVRHLISIPAGIGKMNLKKFLVFTAVGAFLWNTILAYAGFWLGQNWEIVYTYLEPVSLASTVVLIILAAAWLIFRKRNPKKIFK